MNLTLRQLEILVAAADAKTFSAAAAAIGISQPALSESIQRIEHELGISLFERTTRSLKLTEAGARTAGIARELVQDFRRAMERLTTGTSQGRIAIAALPSIACAVLPQALTKFARIHPGVTVELHDVQHERAIALLRDGFTDIAVTLKPAPDKDLHFDDVAFDTAHLVCRRDHPLARKKTVRWRDLAGHPFIGITRISSVRRLTDAAFAQDGTPVLPRFEVEQVPSAIALVEAGLGVTALPSLTFAMFRNHDLAMRPLSDPPMRRHIGFVTRARRILPSFVTDLRKLIGVEIDDQLKESRR